MSKILSEEKHIGKLYKWLGCSIDKSHLVVLGVYCILTLFFEAMAVKQIQVAAVIASRLWMLGWVICIFIILGMFIKSIMEDIRERRIIALVGIALFIVVLTFTLGNLSKLSINGESTLQLAAGLNGFAMPDWNIAGRGFIDYPARQYLIVSAPALFFGRTIFSLILGFGYPFYLGLMLMYLGIRKVTANPTFAVAVVSAIWLFPYTSIYYIYFEQTMIPFAFTMQAIGWILLLVKKPTLPVAFGLAWTCALFPNMYTPGMISLLLFLAILGGIVITTKFGLKKWGFDVLRIQGLSDKLSISLCSILVIFPVAITGIGMILGGQNSNLAVARNTTILEFVSDMAISCKAYFLSDGATFTGLIGLVVIVYILMALSFRLGIMNVVVALWVLGVIGATCFFTGYTTGHGQLVLFRALVTIPVLVTAVGLTIFGYVKKKNIELNIKVVAVILAFNLFMGAYYLSIPFVELTPAYFLKHDHTAMPKYIMDDMEDIIKEYELNHEDEVVIVVEEELSDGLQMYLDYFYPNAYYATFAQGEGMPVDAPVDKLTVAYYDAASTNVNPVFSEASGVNEFYIRGGKQVEEGTVPELEGQRIAVRKVIPPN